jgi:hypothetical protein
LDDFEVYYTGVGVGIQQSHGEIAGHFLGEFADAVESGIDHGAHPGESGAFGEARKVGVIEVVVADEVVVFALLLCVDISEEGAKVIDAAEVFEVEDLFHGVVLLFDTTN